MPGSNKFTNNIPSNRLNKDALINHRSVFPPIRPTAFISPSLATPTTRVVNTNGATIIFISLKNMSAKIVSQSNFESLAFMLLLFCKVTSSLCCNNDLYSSPLVSENPDSAICNCLTESDNNFMFNSAAASSGVFSKAASASFFWAAVLFCLTLRVLYLTVSFIVSKGLIASSICAS